MYQSPAPPFFNFVFFQPTECRGHWPLGLGPVCLLSYASEAVTVVLVSCIVVSCQDVLTGAQSEGAKRLKEAGMV